MSDTTSPKKAKTEDVACVKEDATIPVNTVTRMLQLKVAGEKEALAAEAVLKELHEIMKHVEGFQGANRFVCKEHWDIKYFARLADVKSLVGFMESTTAKEKVAPLIQQLEGISKDKKVHLQNFVADDWA